MRSSGAERAPAVHESLTRLAGRLREVLFGGDRLGVAELEGGHEGGVHLRGGDDGALELLVARGTGVVHHDAPVAEVARRASPGVHAHVAHRPADHHLLDPWRSRMALRSVSRKELTWCFSTTGSPSWSWTFGWICAPLDPGAKNGASAVGNSWRTWTTRSPAARAAASTRAALSAADSIPLSVHLLPGK